MDRLKLFQAINYIDDDLIDEARVNRSATKVRMYTICSAAAALFLVIGISLFYNINHFKISDSAPIKAPAAPSPRRFMRCRTLRPGTLTPHISTNLRQNSSFLRKMPPEA